MVWKEVEIKTIGDFIEAVLKINSEPDAAAFFEQHVADIEKQIQDGIWNSKFGSQAAARSNIGWCFGEGMEPERIKMWVSVCRASHPVFGTSLPDPQDALEAGKLLAKHALRHCPTR